MKKIITAIGDKYLNERLKKENFKILGKDIQYLEGIFEQLEVQEDVDVIIISTKLVKDNKYKEIIYKINLINKNIKIIFIIERKSNRLIKFLQDRRIKYYFNLNNSNIKYLINYLNIKNIKLNKKIKLKRYKKGKNKISQVVTITGPNGVGKTTFISILIRIKQDKILIIDLDKSKNSLHILYKVNKNKYQNKNNLIKINNNIDLLLYSNIQNNKNINKIINRYKFQYRYIIVDVDSYIKNSKIRRVLQNSNEIIFMTEGNLLQLKKSKNLLEFYLNNWNINKNKMRILLNKKNKNTIQTKIIKDTLYEINYLGDKNFNHHYDNLINSKLRNLKLNPKIIKEYKKIINKL